MESASKSRSLSFVALSTGMHLFLAAGIATLTIQMPPTERTEIEILESQPPIVSAQAMPAQAPSETPAIAPAQTTTPTPKAAPVKSPSVAKVAAPVVIASADQVADDIEKSLENSADPTPEASLNDNHSTELNSALVAAPSEVETKDVENDVDDLKVDDSELTSAAAKDINQKAQEDLKEKETSTAALIAAHKAAADRAATDDAKVRASERKALSDKMAAQEKAQAQAREQAAAAALAAESEASAKLAQQNAAKEQANGTALSSAGVRALEDLKQMPGNKRPIYDNDDRLYQRQGQVAFAAYVSKDGSLVNFKMIKSTGHRELDKKTLQTLKSWKFFPGQEGWVEIPFSWDLVGGAKEMPTTLRRSGMIQTQ